MKRGLVLGAMVVACSLSVAISSPAEADTGSEAVGEAVSKCFHPFSDYVSVRFGEKQRSGHTLSVDGTVKYRPLDNKVYSMPFTLQVREVDGEKEWRVVPDDENDNGKMGPDPQCRLRSWQPLR